MAKVFIEESTLTNIGNSIRNKTGKTELIDPALMSAEIDSISAGGGGALELSPEDLILTSDQDYMFYKGKWQWFLDKYGKYMSTNNITYARYMFSGDKELTKVPFEINFYPNYITANYMFESCENLVESPKLNISATGTISSGSNFNINNIFAYCYNVNNLDNAFNSDVLEQMLSNFVATNNDYYRCYGIFTGCRSLRTVPAWVKKLKSSNQSTGFPHGNYCLYNNMFNECYSLDEIIDLPVLAYIGFQYSNMFHNTLTKCGRIKNFTFELNNGVPYVVKWKEQIIDLTNYVGCVFNTPPAGSGLTSDKFVKNNATYQALKNDPDWWTSYGAYSRYNHDSAVATINSLPDTSAYLAENGGSTNTIKFKGGYGESTDGGAINTLTEEEIAVATAKGWTVTLV